MNVAEQVIAIIAAQARVEPEALTPATALESLGLDSLGLVETVFALEERFDISVPFNPNAEDPAAAGGFDISTIAAVIRGTEALVAARHNTTPSLE